MGVRIAAVMVGAMVATSLASAPADATFRGGNGKIAHVYNEGGNVEIFTVNPDGTGRTNITNDPAARRSRTAMEVTQMPSAGA